MIDLLQNGLIQRAKRAAKALVDEWTDYWNTPLKVGRTVPPAERFRAGSRRVIYNTETIDAHVQTVLLDDTMIIFGDGSLFAWYTCRVAMNGDWAVDVLWVIADEFKDPETNGTEWQLCTPYPLTGRWTWSASGNVRTGWESGG
jgi:hypothetical protein